MDETPDVLLHHGTSPGTGAASRPEGRFRVLTVIRARSSPSGNSPTTKLAPEAYPSQMSAV
ncbi:hypothetical protein [Corynebacterium pygosceleis]|uniref:Uncharacterized protein n=1 Tax=Corynebacterium pygosceleis TaxID=2800406 RepID=A0ABT3WT91_9CORY|nr:hypothetical protein [Corynebacterium pygosceleis]MCK7674215.1 hypothetical protein [Corynebacterium pygosceleis]MCX7444033.1 hypothetical protein [Corynebacterium pygosceleis]